MSPENARTPLLADLYTRYLENQDASVYIAKVSQRYTAGTLERLSQHTLREVRRAAVLALGYVGEYDSNPVLGRALIDEDRTVRLLADTGIRAVWVRAGDEAQRKELAYIARLNAAQHYQQAIERATRLIERAAWYAEGWNQRAIALFALSRFAESIRDCHQVLEINPYHFAAASGMGQAYLRLGNHLSALEAFRRALRLNPDLEGVRVQTARLERLVEGKSPGGATE